MTANGWLLRLCGMLALGCGGELRSANPPQADPTRVAAAPAESLFTVDTATLQLPMDLPAQLYVEHDAVVIARAAGTIDSIFVELGDRVTAGQPLAQLERGAQEIALAQAEAARDNAARIAARARTLTGLGGVTAADSEQVEFQLRQAENERRRARWELALARVIAPFAGVVSARAVRPGQLARLGDTLFRVTEALPLFARIRVPEASAARVHIGAPAEIIASTGGTTPATVIHAAPVIDAGSGTREIVLRLGRSQGNLRAGANVVVRVGLERRRVVMVAREAIAPEGHVLVMENGRPMLRAVTLGARLEGGRVEVLRGLSPGERLTRPTP